MCTDTPLCCLHVELCAVQSTLLLPGSLDLFLPGLMRGVGEGLVVVLQDKKKHKEVESTFWGVVLMLGYLGYGHSALGFPHALHFRPCGPAIG